MSGGHSFFINSDMSVRHNRDVLFVHFPERIRDVKCQRKTKTRVIAFITDKTETVSIIVSCQADVGQYNTFIFNAVQGCRESRSKGWGSLDVFLSTISDPESKAIEIKDHFHAVLQQVLRSILIQPVTLSPEFLNFLMRFDDSIMYSLYSFRRIQIEIMNNGLGPKDIEKIMDVEQNISRSSLMFSEDFEHRSPELLNESFTLYFEAASRVQNASKLIRTIFMIMVGSPFLNHPSHFTLKAYPEANKVWDLVFSEMCHRRCDASVGVSLDIIKKYIKDIGKDDVIVIGEFERERSEIIRKLKEKKALDDLDAIEKRTKALEYLGVRAVSPSSSAQINEDFLLIGAVQRAAVDKRISKFKKSYNGKRSHADVFQELQMCGDIMLMPDFLLNSTLFHCFLIHLLDNQYDAHVHDCVAQAIEKHRFLFSFVDANNGPPIYNYILTLVKDKENEEKFLDVDCVKVLSDKIRSEGETLYPELMNDPDYTTVCLESSVEAALGFSSDEILFCQVLKDVWFPQYRSRPAVFQILLLKLNIIYEKPDTARDFWKDAVRQIGEYWEEPYVEACLRFLCRWEANKESITERDDFLMFLCSEREESVLKMLNEALKLPVLAGLVDKLDQNS
jgi:hypothetical protein